MDSVNHLAYVLNLAKFAFRANPLLYASIVVSVLSAAIELLAMSSVLPLFALISGGATAPTGLVARLISMLGMQVNAAALLWAFILLFVIRITTQLIGQSLSTFLGKRVLAQLCSGAFDQIIHRLSIREVNEKSIGYYISLAGEEAGRASTLILSLTQFVSTAALAGLYFAAIAAYSTAAAGFVLAFLACCLIVMIKIVRVSHKLGARQTEESRRAGTLFLDALNNIKAVRAFSAERYVVGIHRSLMFGYARILFWVDEVAFLAKLVPVLLLFLMFGIWLAWSARSIQSVGLAFVVTLIVYLMRFFPVVGQGVNLLLRIASDAKTGSDVTAILDIIPDQQNLASGLLGRINRIELRNVCFSYSKRSEIPSVLNDVNLRLESGRSYALVGKSGIGKSTLVDILLKFYVPTSGHLRLNDVPISDIADAEIRKKVILVSQEAAIFDDTVKNNVCMGLEADLVKVQAACRMACIHDAIEAMPDGYNERLQYRGANLSGGQRQRIAIARALLRNADVLVLDEGTSALDKATQTQVIENILGEYSKRIVILVTHDPYLIQRVDHVIDLEKINSQGMAPIHASAAAS